MNKQLNLTVSDSKSNFANYSYEDYKKNSKHFDKIDIILIISFCIIFIVGVTGNSVVIYLTRCKNSKLSSMKRLIFYLALIDLFASICNPIMFIYWTVTGFSEWHFGEFLCKLLPSLTRITVNASIGLIILITVDRCLTIKNTFGFRFKKKHINIATIITLLVSVAFELPYTIYQEKRHYQTCEVHDASIPGFTYPMITLLIIRDVLFIIMFSLTISIIHLELHNKERVHFLNDQKNIEKTKRIITMLIVMAVVFVILVFPRDILHLAYNISWLNEPGIPYNKTFKDVNSFLKVLHMCNSVCNVFIYARLHYSFRRRLIRLAKSFTIKTTSKQ